MVGPSPKKPRASLMSPETGLSLIHGITAGDAMRKAAVCLVVLSSAFACVTSGELR